MKFEAYNVNSGAGTPKSPTVTGTSNINAISRAMGSAFGDRAMSAGLSFYADIKARKDDEEDRSAIVNAMDAYNRGRYEIMYNKDTGLMHTAGEGANGITQSYSNQDRELQQNILSNTKLHSVKNKNALINLMARGSRQGYEQVDQWQYKQGEVAKDNALKNNIDGITAFLSKDFRSPNSVEMALDNAHIMVSARYGDLVGGDVLQEKQKAADIQVIGGVITNAINSGDYDGAEQLLNKYEKLLGDEVKGNLEKYFFNAVADNKRMEKVHYDRATTEFSKDVYDMKQEGRSATEAMTLAAQRAGNDAVLYRGYMAAVNLWYGGTGKNTSGKLNNDDIYLLDERLKAGDFPTRDAYLATLKQKGASDVQLVKGVQDYTDFLNSTGRFKYNSQAMLNSVIGQWKVSELGNNKKYVEDALNLAVGRFISKYRTEHKGADPTEEDVRLACEEALKSQLVSKAKPTNYWFNKETYASAAQLAALGIVEQSQPDRFGNVNVKMYDGRQATYKAEEFENLVKSTDSIFKSVNR